MKNSTKLKRTLFYLIEKLAVDSSKFLVKPESNFTRNRKLNLNTMIKLIICMEAGSIKDELYKYFGLNIDNPTASAFVQQRQKIKVDAFKWLFDEFNKQTQDNKTKYKGYRLLAIDGSSILIRHDESDEETYICGMSKSLEKVKGHNAFHITASYDLLEHTYDDFIIQGKAKNDENGAFNSIVDRYHKDKTIFIADRGFESYNSFEHVVVSNNKYLIRVKDIYSSTSLIKGLKIEEENEFDIDVKRFLTRRSTNYIKSHPEIYKFMPQNQKFDYFNEDKNIPYEFNCRIVRFKLSDDSYECIVTNLDRDEFPVEEIKKLYGMRWGIETSFRELKYSVGLVAFHAKKKESIKQEIYAKFLFYNFSERIIRKVKPKNRKTKSKYEYQINSTRAFHNIYAFLKIKGGIKPPNIESIISKEIEPIRPGRSDPRKIRKQSPINFVYRFI